MNQVLDGIDKVVTAISGVLYMPWVPFLLLAGLFFLMMTAGMAFLMVMVIAVGSSGNQLSFQIGLHRLICISLGPGAQLHSCFR